MYPEEDPWHPYEDIGRETILCYLGGPVNGHSYQGATSWRDDFGAQLRSFGHHPLDPVPRSTGAFSTAQGNLDQAALVAGIAPKSIPDACERTLFEADVVILNLMGVRQLPGGTYGTPFEHALAWTQRLDSLGLVRKRILIVADFDSVWFERADEILPDLEDALESIVSGETQRWWLSRQAALRRHQELSQEQQNLYQAFNQSFQSLREREC